MLAASRRLKLAAEREWRRRRRTEEDPSARVDIRSVCHAKQANLVDSLVLRRARNVSVLAGRQSGKSHGGALGSILLAARTPGVNIIYVTSTYASCEKMAFRPAVLLNEQYGLGGVDTKSPTMAISFPNGSVVWFLGADSDKTVARLRGTPNLILCIIDEAGIYDSDTLKAMIEAVRPGLRPLAGALVVMGTPSLAGKLGTWYDITESSAYEQHYFTYRDNDRVPTFAIVEELIDEDLKAQFPDLTPEQRRLTAYYLREYLARFEVDMSEKVYQFSDDLNLYDSLPENLTHSLVVGDIGVTAEDAFLTLEWADDDPTIYLTEEWIKTGETDAQLGEYLDGLYARKYPIKVGLDAGGMGKRSLVNLQEAFPSMPLEAVPKPAVNIQIKALNDVLKRGRFKVRRGSRFAAEVRTPTWVSGVVNGKVNEHGKHSNVLPAARYGVLLARPYLPDEPQPPLPPPTMRDRYREQALKDIGKQSFEREAAELGVRLDEEQEAIDPMGEW